MADLTARQVADRLGVKVDTVYAYASRGALRARRRPGSRLSLFDPAEVEVLARRGRPRRSTRPVALDLVVETGLTTIAGSTIRYRGLDACAMARSHSFEQVATWLWTGRVVGTGDPWDAYRVLIPPDGDVRDRIRAAVVAAGAAAGSGTGLAPSAVTQASRCLIATMVEAVPAASETRGARLHLPGQAPRRGSIAGRLWSRLSPGRPSPAMVATLNAALVLLADHELASSTLAARIAASVRADPFSVVLAGLGPLAGPLHGGASALAHRLLADAARGGTDTAASAALERDGRIPGFGHPLYPDGDPRARVLLDMLRSSPTSAPVAAMAGDLARAAARRTGLRANVDLALAALTVAARMPASAGETIFTIARTAGWIAHALEEYSEPPLRFRARAVERPAAT